MLKYLKVFMVILFYHIPIFSHCQIPCGIYSDAMQIVQIKEDLHTMDKAIKNINKLSTKFDPQTLNQINRWISTKEAHAQNIQNIISEYFLTQRIKEDSKNYVKKVTTLHSILISAMKCKQNTDLKNVAITLEHINKFSELYFDKHGLEHIKSLEKSK